jgi:hypothetical protein
MPQRVNSKSDIGNTKRASDVYDVNNCFLTDQGWVYRHFKGDPASTDRFWDEILVAGASDGDDDIEYSTETSKGSLLVDTPTFEGGPDTFFDVMYSKHTENGSEFGDPTNYVSGVNATPPGPDPEGYEQFPSLDVSTSTVTSTSSNDPFAVNGYYPLYTTAAAANAAGNGSNHTHLLNGTTYYMPNGVSIWHGNYNS